jgi:hypothetical protein
VVCAACDSIICTRAALGDALHAARRFTWTRASEALHGYVMLRWGDLSASALWQLVDTSWRAPLLQTCGRKAGGARRRQRPAPPPLAGCLKRAPDGVSRAAAPAAARGLPGSALTSAPAPTDALLRESYAEDSTKPSILPGICLPWTSNSCTSARPSDALGCRVSCTTLTMQGPGGGAGLGWGGRGGGLRWGSTRRAFGLQRLFYTCLPSGTRVERPGTGTGTGTAQPARHAEKASCARDDVHPALEAGACTSHDEEDR